MNALKKKKKVIKCSDNAQTVKVVVVRIVRRTERKYEDVLGRRSHWI
jgi:hypothetical protein